MNRTVAAMVTIAALASTPIVVGIAIATGPSGVTPAPHVMHATLAEDVKVNADGIKLQTRKPTDVSLLTLTVDPGGTTGWHTHPGFAVISVVKGTGTLYSPDCSFETYGTGEAFVETTDDPPTEFRNETTEPVILMVTFLAPEAAEVSRPEAGPDCG